MMQLDVENFIRLFMPSVLSFCAVFHLHAGAMQGVEILQTGPHRAPEGQERVQAWKYLEI